MKVVIVAAPEASRDGIRAHIVEGVRRLDISLDADVEFAESLPRTEGGKVRAVRTREASAR